MSDFRKEIEGAINRHCQENGSHTPDFLLAEFLCNCLVAFDTAVNSREKWYGRQHGGWRIPMARQEMDWTPPTPEQLANASNAITDQ